MKKYIFITLALISIYLVYTTASAEEYFIIPDSSIRIRIIPNSDSPEDQYIKSLVKEKMEKDLYNLLEDTKSIDDARSTITSNIPLFEENINTIFKNNNYNQTFTINYGYNYFPQKEYKSVIYPEGEYESIVVNIGEGKGSNWWCVLFPPLCLLEANESDNVEYKFLAEEIINKIFK